jgi:hypothetical protein
MELFSGFTIRPEVLAKRFSCWRKSSQRISLHEKEAECHQQRQGDECHGLYTLDDSEKQDAERQDLASERSTPHDR